MKTLLFHLRWAWHELLQHRSRSGATLVGIALAVAVVVSVQGFFRGYAVALQRSLDAMGFEVLVTAKGCPYEAATLVLSGGRIPMYMDDAIARDLAARPEVAAVTRLFLQSHASPEERRTWFAVGVDNAFLQLKPWLRFQRGRWFSSDFAAEAVLGFNAASALRLDVGQRFEMPSVPQPLEVVGILDRTGSQDDGAVFLPLTFAQKASDKKDKLTGIGVKLRSIEAMPSFVEQVQELPNVQVITLAQVRGALLNLVGAARTMMLAIGGIGALVAVAMLFNTVLASVLERLRELAILKAMGASALRLFGVVGLEATLLCAGGTAAGFLLALSLAGLSDAAVRRIVPFVPSGAVVDVDARGVGGLLAAALALGLLACLFPALKAARTRPVITMRLHE